MVQTEFPKLEEFLIGLQRSWEEAMKSMEIAQKYEETIQQEIEESSRTKGQGQCVAGEQKYPFKQTFKEVGPKRYGPFRISKNIGQEAF